MGCLCGSESADIQDRKEEPKPKEAPPPVTKVDDEEVTTYFESCSSGPLYRIIKDNVWTFHNSSKVYDMHIQFTFSSKSSVEPLGETKLTRVEADSIVAEVICRPGEKIQFIRGTPEMLTNKIRAIPPR